MPSKLLKKFASLIEEMKTESKYCLFYNVFILIRRCGAAATLVFLQKQPFLQIFSLLLLNLLTLTWLLKHRPYREKNEMITNLTQEFGYIIIHSVIAILEYDHQKFEYTETTRFILGWIIIGTCSINLILTLLFIILHLIEILKKSLAKLQKLISKEQQQEHVKIDKSQRALIPSTTVKLFKRTDFSEDTTPSKNMKTLLNTKVHSSKRKQTRIIGHDDDDVKEYFDRLAKDFIFDK
jgi:Transient receptor potential (TRP) ion channel.